MNSIVPFLKFISYTCTNDLENNPAVISDKLVRGALFKLGHIYAQANIFDHVIRRCNQAKRKLSAV